MCVLNLIAMNGDAQDFDICGFFVVQRIRNKQSKQQIVEETIQILKVKVPVH